MQPRSVIGIAPALHRECTGIGANQLRTIPEPETGNSSYHGRHGFAQIQGTGDGTRAAALRPELFARCGLLRGKARDQTTEDEHLAGPGGSLGSEDVIGSADGRLFLGQFFHRLELLDARSDQFLEKRL